MSKFLNIMSLAIGIARIAEAAVPAGGQGKAKLAFAVDTAAAVYETEEDLRASWQNKELFLESITRATSTAVRLLNHAGVFQKSQKAS